MVDRKKFFIIDGHALVYRSYFAFVNNHITTKNGQVTSAIYGFTNTLLDLIKKQDPKYICVAFDTKAKTWRHKKLEKYKANRPKQPEDITKSFKFIYDILDALDINFYYKDGYEADDIIGTISKKTPIDIDIYVLTSDKDYDQLINEHTFLFKPKENKYITISKEDVLLKWGIDNPIQVIDMLAIIGDKCDNIDGIKGIGIKTAAKLIKQYGSIENIKSNINSLKPVIKAKIKENLENLSSFKELVTIKTDCDIDFDITKCIIKTINLKKINELFNELEFNSLINKVEKIFNKTQSLF